MPDLTPKQFSARCGMSVQTIRRRIAAKLITTVRIGGSGRARIPESELEACRVVVEAKRPEPRRRGPGASSSLEAARQRLGL